MNAVTRLFCLGLAIFVSESVFAFTASERYFSSELEAVQAATAHYNPISIREDREFMGTIYRSGNYFAYTVTAGDVGDDRIRIRVPADQWDSVVAIWHTHGDASPIHQYFSRIDTRLVRDYGKPLYLADFTGQLKVFSPGDRTLSKLAAERLGLPANYGYAQGTVVAEIDSEKLELAAHDLAPALFRKRE